MHHAIHAVQSVAVPCPPGIEGRANPDDSSGSSDYPVTHYWPPSASGDIAIPPPIPHLSTCSGRPLPPVRSLRGRNRARTPNIHRGHRSWPLQEQRYRKKTGHNIGSGTASRHRSGHKPIRRDRHCRRDELGRKTHAGSPAELAKQRATFPRTGKHPWFHLQDGISIAHAKACWDLGPTLHSRPSLIARVAAPISALRP